MLHDIYVREKLRHIEPGPEHVRLSSIEAGVMPSLYPLLLSLGRGLSQMGDRLQRAGAASEQELRALRLATGRRR